MVSDISHCRTRSCKIFRCSHAKSARVFLTSHAPKTAPDIDPDQQLANVGAAGQRTGRHLYKDMAPRHSICCTGQDFRTSAEYPHLLQLCPTKSECCSSERFIARKRQCIRSGSRKHHARARTHVHAHIYTHTQTHTYTHIHNQPHNGPF